MSTLTHPTPAPTTSAPASRRPRDPWFDNAKMVLVTLVVVGHSWTLVPEWGAMGRLYNFLYLFHMPAFVMITGYLSRSFTYSRRNLRRVVTTLVLPYLVFEGAFALFRAQVGGERLEDLWLNPHWPLWYLVAVVLWRLATPVLRRLPLPLATAAAISLAGGLVSIETFDLNRVMGFLPFYVLGLTLQPAHLDLVRTQATRVIGLAVVALGLWAAGVFTFDLGTSWVYYRNSYAELGAGPAEGMLLRAAMILGAVALSAAVLSWVPARRTWFTSMGAASIVVYLFHGFFVRGAEYAGLPRWAESHPALSFVVITVAAIGVALLLAWRPVARRLETVITPAP